MRRLSFLGAMGALVALVATIGAAQASDRSSSVAAWALSSSSGAPGDLTRLKSGGLASQISGFEPSVSGPPSSPNSSPPFEWAQNINVFPNANEQDEPTIAVNPTNTDNVVVGNHERQGPAFPAGILCVSQASTDGGATWGSHNAMPLQGPVFPATGGHSCSDSVLAADNNGNFYFSYLDLYRFTAPLRVDVLVAKSTNGGASFPSFTVVAQGAGSGAGAEDPDKQWIEVDRSPQSPHQGNIYVTYSDFSTLTIKFRKSTDGGASFQPSPTSFGTVVSDVGFQTFSAPYACGADTCLDVTTRYMQGSNIAVGANGDIYVAYGDFTETETFDLTTGAFANAQMNAAKIMVAKSTDAGATWTRTVARDMCSPAPCRSAGTDSHETKNTPVFRVGTIPFIGAGPNGKLVYVTWAEWNSVTFSFDPPTNRDFAVSDGETRFARSTDGGATWEPAIRVNDDAGTADQFFPALVVSPYGTIQEIWADRRLDPSGVDYDIFYATSTNNGKTFSTNTPVTTTASNPRGTNFVGDYIDIDGASGAMKVHAVWTDRRNVVSPIGSAGNDVFTARRLMPPS